MRFMGVMAAALAGGILLAGKAGAEPPESVVVVPVTVVNGDAENGQRMTDAVAANLVRNGCRVMAAGRVSDAIGEEGLGLDRPQFVPSLTRLGRRLGADLVVYARVLVQGPTIRKDFIDRTRQAMVLHVMIVDARSGHLLVANQVVQEWDATDPAAEAQAAPAVAADAGAERLLRRLYEPVSVSGQLLDEETGGPVSEVETFLHQDGKPPRIVLTDRTGRYAFTGLDRRPFRITTHAPAYRDAGRDLPFNVGETRADLVLAPRTAAVSGVLRDASGGVSAGVLVRALDSEGTQVERALTVSDGSFAIGGLRAGSYTLEAVLPDGTGVAARIDLRPGDLASAELKPRSP